MSVPTITARGTPGGTMLREGFPALITFTRNPTIQFQEKEITPPDFDGGDMIDQTTMFNTRYSTGAPQTLIDVGEISVTAAYDPACIAQIISDLLNQEGSCNIRWRDGSTLSLYAYIGKFELKDLQRGEQPEIDLTIYVTNVDPVAHVEQGPVITSVAGT